MIKNIVFFILLFYFFALLQASFLVHFSLWGFFPNLILITVILLNIFNRDIKLGVGAAVVGGFFLDVFSSNFFGFWILILLTAALFINFVLKRYVRLPQVEKI
jgi:rod shape-determining protein MreD